jgi:hypothetical protein
MRRLVGAADLMRHARCLTRVRQVPGMCLAPGLAVLVLVLAAGCGGDDGASVEQEEFIAELEVPLIPELDEPDFYGQVGLSPNGRNGTRIVIRLDEPFKSPLEAFIRRGGCGGGSRGAFLPPDYDLGEVKGGELETEVDAPTFELRRGYALVVREPLTEEELERSRDRVRGAVFERGACADLASADRVEDV